MYTRLKNMENQIMTIRLNIVRLTKSQLLTDGGHTLGPYNTIQYNAIGRQFFFFLLQLSSTYTIVRHIRMETSSRCNWVAYIAIITIGALIDTRWVMRHRAAANWFNLIDANWFDLGSLLTSQSIIVAPKIELLAEHSPNKYIYI